MCRFVSVNHFVVHFMLLFHFFEHNILSLLMLLAKYQE